MICDGCLVMLACNPGPGAVAIPRLDDVAELHKEFQVICCWADGCLGQLLQRVMFVKWWWRQASAVCAAEVGSCDERVSGEWAHCSKEKVQQVKSAATERATGCLVVCRFTLTYFVG